MKNLMIFIGILASNFSTTWASEFSCSAIPQAAKYSCSGTIKVKNLAELNSYKNNFGVVAKKPTIAKNLLIDFNVNLASDLIVATPCSIKIPSNKSISTTANICLYGKRGISIEDRFKFKGKDLKLESSEEVIIHRDASLKASDIKILSIGKGDISKAYIREGADIDATNLWIESHDKGFIGRNSKIKLSGNLGIYTLGDDEATTISSQRFLTTALDVEKGATARRVKVKSNVLKVIINTSLVTS